MSLKYMSLCHSVFVQFVSFVVLSLLSSCKNMSLKYMSLCHSVFVQFASFVVLSILSSCKNMSLKHMSLCHSVFLSHSVCQMFSQSANESGTNSVRINGFLACKRCPLRRLLTPFWSPIKHLLKSVFATSWQQKTYRGAEITCFRFISIRSLICFVKINCLVDELTSRQVNE